VRHSTFPQPVGERQQIVREGLEFLLALLSFGLGPQATGHDALLVNI
jgi:hypothetical protein